jgi:hypothetical protein
MPCTLNPAPFFWGQLKGGSCYLLFDDLYGLSWPQPFVTPGDHLHASLYLTFYLDHAIRGVSQLNPQRLGHPIANHVEKVLLAQVDYRVFRNCQD